MMHFAGFVFLILFGFTIPTITLNSKQEIFSTATDLTINAFAVAGKSLVFSTNTSLYIYTSGTTATVVRDIANNKDISCYNNECLTANEYSAYPWTIGTNKMANTDSYPLELQSVSRVLFMRVSIIEETNYFLMAAEGAFGITRFQKGNFDTHTKLEILGTSKTDQIGALLAFPGLAYGVASYQGKSFLHGFDISLNLHVFNFDTDAAIGGFVAYTYDTTRNMLGIYTKNSYSIINLLTQHYFFRWDYTGLAASGSSVLFASSPRQSMYTFLVLANQLLIVDHLKDESAPKLYSSSNSNVLGMVYSPESANLFLIYSNKVESYGLTFDFFGECHPNCFGCTKALSQFYCKECSSGLTISSTTLCQASAVILNSTFSADNQLTTKFGNVWIYVVIALCIMLIVGVLLYCIYQGVMQQILDEEANQKMKESEEDEQKKLTSSNAKLASQSNVSSAPITDRPAISQVPSTRPPPENTNTSMKDVSKLKQTWQQLSNNP